MSARTISGSVVADVAIGLAGVFIATVCASGALELPPAIGLLIPPLVSYAYVKVQTTRQPSESPTAAASLFGPLEVPARWLVGATVATVLLGFAAMEVTQVLGVPLHSPIAPAGPNPLETYATSGLRWSVVLSLTVLGAPVIEETAFRGWIQRALQTRLGTWGGIIVSAMLFAVMHVGFVDTARLGVPLTLGIALGIIAQRAGTVRASILVHAVWNALMVACAATWSTTHKAFPATPTLTEGALILLLGLAGVAVLEKYMMPVRPSVAAAGADSDRKPLTDS